jgi:hypothetical protein
MKDAQHEPDTPDESIPQDPGIPGPGTKDDDEWPPESGAAAASADEGFVRDEREANDTSVSEAIDREPRHRARDERKTGR